MSDLNLSIKTTTVEIKVVRVGGRKMTKATFDQIPLDGSYGGDQDSGEDPEALGWVLLGDGRFFLLITRGGKLRKRFVETRSYLTMRDGKTVFARDYWSRELDQLYLAT